MTTREEYAEAAEWASEEVYEARQQMSKAQGEELKLYWLAFSTNAAIAATVLRALADGAVLCRKHESTFESRRGGAVTTITYRPLEDQP